MIEIFSDIPQHIKNITKRWIDFALMQSDFMVAIKMIKEYRDTCKTEEELEFLDFYLNLRVEQLLNEDNND